MTMETLKDGSILGYNVAGVIPINTLIHEIDMLRSARGIAVQIVSMGTTGSITPELSVDGVTWVAFTAVAANGAAAPVATISLPGVYLLPQNARFMRLRLSTATTAGTTNVQITQAGENPSFAATQGNTAAGLAPGGNPVRSAGVAQTAWPTAKLNNIVAELTLSSVGQQINKPYAPADLDWQFTSAVTGVTVGADTIAKAAGAAGVRNYVTGVQVQNASATPTEFQVKDGATVIWRCVLNANTDTFTIHFVTPLKGTAATALNLFAVTAGSVVIASLQGYIAP